MWDNMQISGYILASLLAMAGDGHPVSSRLETVGRDDKIEDLMPYCPPTHKYATIVVLPSFLCCWKGWSRPVFGPIAA
ncbi:unnamed protein product [Pieris macdunnoughi]|uniref:Uncharacterized protein n=1 Tax=Pieris macdunnoughi TaxID=345717 RepID=A0A821M7J4_9NEOP|nr:unnamed protein product [Pieris macdunnoughi]